MSHVQMDLVKRPPVVLRQLEQEGLPPLPQDPDGRHMSWVMVLAGPDVHYHGEVRSWDLAGLVDAYVQYTDGGFEAPVIAEHDPAVSGGKRLGDLTEIREHDGGLIGMVRWAIPDAKDLIESGQIRYTSPGIGSIELHDSGEVLETIYEISVVTSPHQRGATTHVLAKGVTMPEDGKPYTDEEVEDLEEEEEEMSLASRVEVLEAAIARLMEKPEEDDSEEEEEEEMSAEQVEITALRAQNAELTRANEFAEFTRVVVVGSTFTVTEQNLHALFLLQQTDADAFASVAMTAQVPQDDPTPPARMSMTWGERIGTNDVVEPASKPATAVELKALCLAEAGGNAKQANALYCERAPRLGII